MPTSAPSEPFGPERLPRAELEALQLDRLRATAERVLHGQPVGARRLREAGIEGARDVRGLEDLSGVAFASKADLREHYPFGLLTVPREELVRVHASSGTHGKPTVVGYTRGDLEHWTELMARCMTIAGVRPGMVIHNANGYGLFTGGFGFHQGGERIGCTVVPVSGGQTARQVALLRDLGAHVLVSTPSYALVLAQAIEDPGSLPLQLGLFGGEPWTEGIRTELERALPLKAINFYGLSEMCGPGVAVECIEQRDGLHVQEDHFLAEVVDPAGGRRLEPGAMGELVFTTLTREALPLIRYRTGDLGQINTDPCPCGRTTVRLTGLGGRRDDMLIIRGVNIHPSNVEHLLLGVEGVAPYYQLIVSRVGPLDELALECEPASDGVDRDALADRIQDVLRENTGLRVATTVLDPGSVPRSEGKAVRVVDRRGG